MQGAGDLRRGSVLQIHESDLYLAGLSGERGRGKKFMACLSMYICRWGEWGK